MTSEPRTVSITRTASDVFTLTVGDTSLEIDPLELWLLAHETNDALDQPTQSVRLKRALAEALYEVHDILISNPHLTRAYDLTAEDEKALARLAIRVQSPWE